MADHQDHEHQELASATKENSLATKKLAWTTLAAAGATIILAIASLVQSCQTSETNAAISNVAKGVAQTLEELQNQTDELQGLVEVAEQDAIHNPTITSFGNNCDITRVDGVHYVENPASCYSFAISIENNSSLSAIYSATLVLGEAGTMCPSQDGPVTLGRSETHTFYFNVASCVEEHGRVKVVPQIMPQPIN